MEQKKLSILPIFITVFIDLIGTTMLIPILAPLFLSSSILPLHTPHEIRTLLIGVVAGFFPLAQFFGAPILGALSDKYGRKKILLLSLSGTLIARLVFAFGIITQNLPLIIIAPLIDGFTGGNISVAMSTISDVSHDSEKAKNFGLVGAALGLGFIIGPFIGGKLSDPTILPWFNFATPYLFTSILTAFNILLMSFTFKETLSQKISSHVNLL